MSPTKHRVPPPPLAAERIEPRPRPNRRRPATSRTHVWGIDLGNSRVAIDGLLMLAVVLMLLAAVGGAIALIALVL